MTHKAQSVYDYSGNKLCDLWDNTVNAKGQAYNVTITKEQSGKKTLTFKIPFGVDGQYNFRWDYVKSEYLVRVLDGNMIDWYIISKPSRAKSGAININVTCNHISTLLKTKNIYLEFDDENGIGTLQNLIGKILVGTGWTIGHCDRQLEKDGVTEKVRSLKSNSKEGAYALISKTCNLFNVYPVYNGEGKTIDFFSLNNQSVEWELTAGRNLEGITAAEDSDSIVTRLYVEGEYGDFGYVGIDDVNPTGLSYLLNFDYYKSIGLFTAMHQAILDQYVLDVPAQKAQISAAQATATTYINLVVSAVGYTPFTIFDVQNKRLSTAHRINGATGYPDISSDMIGEYDDGGVMRVEHFEYPGENEDLPRAYSKVLYFDRAALGQIGVNESAIEAKEAQIDAWQRKISLTTDIERIAEYETQIAILEQQIIDIHAGTGDVTPPGLDAQYISLISNGLALETAQNYVNTLLDGLDDIEAAFVAAMGEMLRDGRWSDENYTIGQEESLYLDALDMSERCGKPKVTYTLNYSNTRKYIGFGVEDMTINSVGHIMDSDLLINDYGYIKSLTICLDSEDESKVEVTTDDGFSKAVTLESVLTRIAQMAELVKAKNEIYDRAGAISSSGEMASNRLNGVIDVLRNKLSSVTSNWYTDDRGNLIFESVSGNGAMQLCGEGFMIASERNPDGSWAWKTLGDGSGLVADEITAGFLSAERILAGSITADKIIGSYGQTIDLSQNAIQQTIQAVREGASNEIQLTAEGLQVSINKLATDQGNLTDDVDDLQTKSATMEKYLTFGNDYLIIGTLGSDFNVQITNTAINFRKGTTVLAYMNSQKLFIPESEITKQMRIGNYLWTLPGGQGAAGLIYMPAH